MQHDAEILPFTRVLLSIGSDVSRDSASEREDCASRVVGIKKPVDLYFTMDAYCHDVQSRVSPIEVHPRGCGCADAGVYCNTCSNALPPVCV